MSSPAVGEVLRADGEPEDLISALAPEYNENAGEVMSLLTMPVCPPSR